MFLVCRLTKEIEIEITNMLPGYKHTVPLDYAEGMIGACPVFETREAAEEWADGASVEEIAMKHNEELL